MQGPALKTKRQKEGEGKKEKKMKKGRKKEFIFKIKL